MSKQFINGLVSVIMPVYNAERFVKQAIMSILSQTYKEVEIIIVDDCSIDKSFDIIKELMAENKNIFYYKNEKNLGPAVARNKAIELSKGRFLAFLDSDDIWQEEKIEKQLEMMKQKNAAFSYTAIETINEMGNTIKLKKNIKQVVDYNYILKNTIIPCSTVIVDRNLLGDFRMPLIRAGQDYATWLLLLRKGIKAYGLNEALVKYRKVPGSVSSNKFQSLKKVWRIYRELENINFFKSLYFSLCFAVNAVKKHYS
ncbi:teichuronic acid biosynthesis glycosyltransferase TuaG [Planomicrobium soli]|uniref:Teichuronic acid biosynthesis glycosyltransferase TuaG n=1 Tax=Planomicrobium soli TaxID=1176648 RepID=A0A2P8H393_9BACL|nr:glycosyltransferase family 2 protein [Planomicrobium soli]PSL40696.1 teichuronic acid biosynthesis glycosyltransferase TuaG [Planomicrobium soli]